MTVEVLVHRITPGATLQDSGRLGLLAYGVSRGGALDRTALVEGAALLGQSADLAALELPGSGGVFEATGDMRIALTGASMRAQIDGDAVVWNASHLLAKGSVLEIGAVTQGSTGYLHVGGGFDVPLVLNARSAHLAARVGHVVSAGERLCVGHDGGSDVGLTLPRDDRFDGGVLRIVESFQTRVYDAETRQRFVTTIFSRDARANRMGMQLNSEGDGFFATGGLNILSETIVPGDIQITGDGTPFLLMAESQTTGGYPRIATVLPCDLARAAQTPAGQTLQFEFVSRDDALKAEAAHRAHLRSLTSLCQPLVRDPATIRDLLSYQLISGATAGTHDHD